MCKIKRCFAFIGKFFCCFDKHPVYICIFYNIIIISGVRFCPIVYGIDSAATLGMVIRYRVKRDRILPGISHHCLGKRVFAFGFKCICKPYKLSVSYSVRCDYIRNNRFSLGYRSCFIQKDYLRPSGCLK